jgi:TonB-dependent SusC/RagA subfamily outer membrane receptor
MKSRLLPVILFSIIFFNLNAQKSNGKITISGTVMDVNNNPIANAIIMVDNKKTETQTDSEGHYSVKVKPTALKIGIFTFSNGYYEEEINKRTLIDISLSTMLKAPPLVAKSEDNLNSEEAELRGRNKEGEVAINIGYAYIKRKYLAGDIDFIDASEKKYSRYTCVQDMITHNISGVTQYGDKLVIMGACNFFGPVEPLVLIDGAYAQTSDLSLISPVTVRSIAVLKSASASIYGSRANGGVIIVTTRFSN